MMVFFHVLSGFTLAYVYPALENRAKLFRFWLARIGRVWPLHAALLVLLVVFLRHEQAFDASWWRRFVCNITLTQSWFPIANVHSFNLPAWSLSTEFFMYLLFPLLIRDLGRTWHWKLAAALLLAVGTVCYFNYSLHHAGKAPVPPLVERVSAVYMHPFVRLFEFILGMTMGFFWSRLHARMRLGAVAGTIMEAGAVAFCVSILWSTHGMTAALDARFHLGPIWSIWLESVVFPLVPFASLVFVFSMNWGKISSLLSLPLFVVLGDLSFAIYLIHMPLVYVVWAATGHQPWAFASWYSVAAYWCCLLLVSHIAYHVWEQPCRNFFRNLAPGSGRKRGTLRSWMASLRAILFNRWAWIELTASLSLMIAVNQLSRPGARPIGAQPSVAAPDHANAMKANPDVP